MRLDGTFQDACWIDSSADDRKAPTILFRKKVALKLR